MIGDVVGTLSVSGHGGATFTLVNNPNGSLALSGNTLTQAADLPDGTYTFSIRATPLGGSPSFTQSITLTHQSGAPTLAELLQGYNVVWSDNFQSLSLRTGFKFTDHTSGLAAGLGTWASVGQSYMNQDQGFPGFGRDYWIRNDYNWQAIDPAFPPLGMIDIGPNGVVLNGSEDHPLVRAAIPADSSGFPRFLSSLIMSGYSAKIATPYARRVRWTLASNGTGRYDFPAVWGLGELYAGYSGRKHQEVDDIERFGVDYPVTWMSQGLALLSDGVSAGGPVDTGSPIVDRVMETVIVQTNDTIYFFINNVFHAQGALGPGFDTTDLHHTELNMATGFTFHAYPGSFTASISGTIMTVTDLPHLGLPIAAGQTIIGAANGTTVTALDGTGTGDIGTYSINPSQTLASTVLRRGAPVVGNPKLTVHSVEILAPSSNTTGVFPPSPPVPVLTWGGSYAGGNIDGTIPINTVVATLSGASTYSLLDYNGAVPSGLGVSGSNLKTNTFLSPGSYDFYIKGVSAGGVPGIAPKLTATIVGTPIATLTAPFVYQIGPTIATLSVGTNMSGGALYWIVDTSATPPSSTQIIAGQNHSGGAPTASGNQAVPVFSTQIAPATGLTASTSYYVYFLHRNAFSNNSPITSAPFATTATGTAWDAVAYLGPRLKCWFDTVDTSTLTIASGAVAAWAAKVGGQTATPSFPGTANPPYSATARNGLPGVIFTGAEQMQFSASGLPTGDGTIVMVGYQNSTDGVFRVAGGYGDGTGTRGHARLIATASNSIFSYTFGDGEGNGYSWSLNDRISITQYKQSTGIVTQSIDGNLDPSSPSVPLATSTSVGILGASPDTGNPFKGTQQCWMFIDGDLTPLEQNKLEGWVARRYNLLSQLPANHPYKNFAPTNEATLDNNPLNGFSVVWQDTFQSLSLRTGGYFSGTTTGYNDPLAVGTWAPSGHSYMNDPKGFDGFGRDFFLNPFYNWQGVDPTFPPLGMMDITSEGLVMFGSENYPAIRSTLGTISTPIGNQYKYLSSLLCTAQSMKMSVPFARRWLFTLPSTGSYDFPALWSLGDKYNGSAAHPKHQEWDDFERFGIEFVDGSSSQGLLLLGISPNFSHGVKFNVGTAIAGGGQTELITVVTADRTLFYTNGILTNIAVHPVGFDPADLMHAIANFATGMSFEEYPGMVDISISGTTATIAPHPGGHVDLAVGQLITHASIAAGTIITDLRGINPRGFGGDVTVNHSQTVSTVTAAITPVLTIPPKMTVQSVQYLAPPTNATGIFPATPPVPVLTWGGGFTAGALPVGTANGTVVATLSGATTFSLMDHNGAAPSHLAVSGSNVVVSGSLVAGSFDFYIRGVSAGGTPGIAPKLTATISGVFKPLQFVRAVTNANISHAINVDIRGNTLFLASGFTELGIYDITVRDNPVRIGGASGTFLNAVSGVRVFGNYAFCSCEQRNSLAVVDITDLTAPVWRTELRPFGASGIGGSPDFLLSGASNIKMNSAGTMVLIPTITRQSLFLADVSNPLAPTQIKEIQNVNMQGCREVAYNEATGYAYVACEYTNNIAVIDMRTPSAASYVRSVTNASNPVQRGCCLNESGTRLYVVGSAGGVGGLDIWDITTPDTPTLVHFYQASGGLNFYGARFVFKMGNYIYLGGEFGSMVILLDISNENSPVLVDSESNSSLNGLLYGQLMDGYAYLGNYDNSSLLVVKVNAPYPTPVTPVVLSRIISAEYTAANPGFSIKMPTAKGVGTVVQIQIQAAGGAWSSLLVNTTNTLTSTQDKYEKVSNAQTALSSGNKEARAIVDGVTSNVVSWTV